MQHAVHQRIKTLVIFRLAGGEGHRAHRASVERAGEADEVASSRMIARKFDRRLHRFRSRVGHKRNAVILERRDVGEFFAEFDPFLVIKIGRDVNEFLRLFLNRFDDFRVGMSR
jgi:hypothetical protein